MVTLDDVKTIINDLVNWKVYGDATSLMIMLASIADWLPSVAALFSIIWLCIRIYETDTVQQLIFGHKHEKD